MNRLHLILAAALDAARAGGLPEDRAEAVFNALSGHLAAVPAEAVAVFEANVRRILDADLPRPHLTGDQP
jgi:hypothetical protein